jgi:hypothetical protein
MDLLSLRFEEVNYLWGFLVTRLSLSAIFRGRLVVVSDQRVLETAARIQELEITAGGVAHDSLPALV